MSEWKEVRLGDIFNISNGYAFKSSDFIESGIPVIKIKNVKPNTINFNDLSFVSSDFLKSKSSFLIKPNDILITMSGNRIDGSSESWVGKVAKFAHKGNYFLNQRVSTLRLKDEITHDITFLSYLLSSWDAQLYFIKHSNSSGGQANISPAIISEYILTIPPLAEQKKIAGILSALDGKIETNRRINARLEELAQVLFKSWFIDFAPFGGQMPEDWKFYPLGEICSCALGGTPNRAKPEFWNGEIPWINSGEVNKFRIFEPSEHITTLGLNKSATKLLPKGTVVLAITGATLGQVSLLEIDTCANQSVVGVIPTDKLPSTYLYLFICSAINTLISYQTGGAQQHINKQNVESLPILIPDDVAMLKFHTFINPLFERISNLCFESARLAELRDTLLPKLMSGKFKML